MSTYTSNIPQPGDNPSQSQDQILQNFQSISTVNGVNHVAFNDANEGKHKFLQMPEQGSAPTTASDEGGLYTKAVSAVTQLFWRNENNGTEQQFTNTSPSASGSDFAWNFANGLQIRFGTKSHTGTSTAITFSTAFTNNAYSAFLTPIGGAATTVAWNAQGLSTTGFTLASISSGTGSFYYLAVGR